MKCILTIAGSDSSGGAGIQADIKTITAHNMYAMSAVTALTAQNTTGVYGILEVTPKMMMQQIDCVFNDIRPQSVKIGMVSNPELIHAIAARLIHHKATNIVIDPVMIATSGSKLLTEGAVQTLLQHLLPLGTVITPNIPEAEVLSGIEIQTEDHMLLAAQKIALCIPGAILIKGGHRLNDATDLLYHKGHAHWYRSKRIVTPNSHGTGCTLSSAIACHLADGLPLVESIALAKDYVTGALASGLCLGKGNGPINHMHLFCKK